MKVFPAYGPGRAASFYPGISARDHSRSISVLFHPYGISHKHTAVVRGTNTLDAFYDGRPFGVSVGLTGFAPPD